MIWVGPIIIAILAGTAGAFAGGGVGAGAVKWYRIPSREGASGYFIGFCGLIGIVAGLIIGLTCGAAMGAGSGIGFLKGLGLALAVVAMVAGAVALAARLLADVPPKIARQELFLVVEVLWPPDWPFPPPAEPGEAFLRLGSLSGHVMRKSIRGMLWKEEAREVDGRWLVRGAVKIFTSRGRRTLEIHAGPELSESFLVPLPGFPGRKYQQWSDWLPHPRRDGKPLGSRFSYRFRVQRWSEPMKTESFGNFEFDTITRDFYEATVDGCQRVAADDRFRIRFRGKPLAPGEICTLPASKSDPLPAIDMIATFTGTSSPILINVLRAFEPAQLYLVSDAGSEAKVALISESASSPALDYLGPGAKRAAPWIPRNRRQLDRDGLYHVAHRSILDTRSMRLHQYTTPPGITEAADFRTLGMSPDERSFVRFTLADVTLAPMLTATDFVADRSEVFPIDRKRMRYSKVEELDHAWVQHHFLWERNADGVDRLALRADFQPLPYRGELTCEGGKYVYRVANVIEPVRAVLEEVLVTAFNADRLPASNSYEHILRLNGTNVSASTAIGSGYGYASVELGTDLQMAETVAERFNAELATGTHDELFVVP